MSEFDSKRKIAEKAEQRNNVRKEKLAGYLYDISKLIFGGIVLGIVTDIIVQEWIFNKKQHEVSVNMHKPINKMKVRK